MVEHRQEFQRELEVIEAKVTGLFAMVAEDLPGATYALPSGSSEVLGALADRDQVIDALYREIDRLASREILLQAPVASDLRFLLSVVRVVPELERSHDLVVQIASRAGRSLGAELSPDSRRLAGRIGDVAWSMWRQVADSWRHRDRSVAAALVSIQNYLTNAGIAGCTLSTSANALGNFAWTFNSTSAGCGGNPIVEIERNVQFVANGATVFATRVTLNYPFSWTFSSVIKLLVPSASFSSSFWISTNAIMQNSG